jgi:TonB family protein
MTNGSPVARLNAMKQTLLVVAAAVALQLIAADDPAEPLRLASHISAPKILKKVAPEYTLEAVEARHQGSVLLDVIVSKDGSVKSVTVRRSLGMGLDERAADAISRWKFAPARLKSNNSPVEVMITISVGFSLNEA